MRTYGTARLEAGRWLIECEPHVMMRLKRTFARLAVSTHGTASLKATDEVSRDLLWFTQRFPLVLEEPGQLQVRAQRHVEACDSFDRLLSGSAQPQAFELAIPPRDYQRVGAELALRARGLLIADDVGVGKTATAICMLSKPETRPALVVTLTHLPKQWEREIKRFCPQLKTHVLKKGTPYDVRIGGSKNKRQQELVEPEFPDVLICNYHKLSGWADSLHGVVKSVVFDEIQELRRGDSQKATSARYIAQGADIRLGLSATPIYNYGSEFWHVLSVLRPDAVGSLEEFMREWCIASYDADKATIKDPKAFGTYVREVGLMIRRTRRDVARELPPLSRVVQYCDADEAALRDAESTAAELARVIMSSESTWEDRGTATRELDWRLRQATGIAKAPYVAEFVRMLVESGERVLLYGWHRAVYDLWMERLKELRPVLFSGSESPTQKEAAAKAFIDGQSSVLIMSLRAGAGLDGLQHACRTVVFGELDWSPGVHEQAEGRVFRDGQPDGVAVYYLVSDSGSDPIISDTLGVKRGQIEGVKDPFADVVERLDTGAKDGLKRLAMQYLARKKKSPGAAAAEATAGAAE